jgi:acyl carrier protein
MQDRSTWAPRARLIELVTAQLEPNSGTQPVSPDDNLTEIGVSSLGLVKLMLAIEAEFDIMIPTSEITPENLRSVATIEALIARRANSAAQP